jgi:hypothetical protein
MLKLLKIVFAIKCFISLNATLAVAALGVNRCVALFAADQVSNPEIYSESLQSRIQLEGKARNSSRGSQLQLAARLFQFADSLHSRFGSRLHGQSNGDPASRLIGEIVSHYQDVILPLAEIYEANRAEITLLKRTLAEQARSSKKLKEILDLYTQDQDFHFNVIIDSLFRARFAHSMHVLADPSFLFKNNFTPLEIEAVEWFIAQVSQR